MFFVLSKVLFFLIQPLNWVVGLFLYSVFGKNQKWKKRCRNTSLILLIFFTNHFLFNLVMRGWETDLYPVTELPQTYDIGIVLGGYSNFFLEDQGVYNFSPHANRLTQSVQLYRRGIIKKILLTGGSGGVLKKQPSEAQMLLPYLLESGIPREDIILEPKSRNTHENALFTKQLLSEQYPNASCLLITSAFHMRRSKGCFRKEGVAFTPFSVDPIGERLRFVPGSLLIPNRDGFYRWELLIKEWVGYVVYWMRGYI